MKEKLLAQAARLGIESQKGRALLAQLVGVDRLEPGEARRVFYALGGGGAPERVRDLILRARAERPKREALARAREQARERLVERIRSRALSFWAAWTLRRSWAREGTPAQDLLGDEDLLEADPELGEAWEVLGELASPWPYLPEGAREEAEEWARRRAEELRQELPEPEPGRLPDVTPREDSREWEFRFRDFAGREHRARVVAEAQAAWQAAWDRDPLDDPLAPVPAGAKVDPHVSYVRAAAAAVRVEVDGRQAWGKEVAA